MKLVLILAMSLTTLVLGGCAATAPSNSPMPEWGKTAHEEAADKGL